MIEPHWKCIAGIQFQEGGEAGIVWLALEPERDLVHLYDACVFMREVPAVIAAGINARGRYIPVAWEEDQKSVADQLLDRGCRMLPEPVKETPLSVEVTSRELWERMRTGRFKVDKRLAEWLDEFKKYTSADGKAPLEASPLMVATRIAIASLPNARRQAPKGKKKIYHPELVVV